MHFSDFKYEYISEVEIADEQVYKEYLLNLESVESLFSADQKIHFNINYLNFLNEFS